MKNTITQLEKSKEEFEKGIKIQKNNGSPYFPNWDAIESFLIQSSHDLILAIIEDLQPKTFPELESDDYDAGYERAVIDIQSSLRELTKNIW